METSVQSFVENYAAALISFSAEAISSFYQVPLTIYSDQGTRQVSEMAEVVDFWEEGVKPYAALHIEKTVPEILNQEQLAGTIFVSKIRWKNYDGSGSEVSRETNFYILSQSGEELKISGLILVNI